MKKKGQDIAQGNVASGNVACDCIVIRECVILEKLATANYKGTSNFIGPTMAINGMTICKGLSVDFIQEKSTGEGVMIGDIKFTNGDLCIPAPGKLLVDEIIEKTLDTGVTIEGVLIKDGMISVPVSGNVACILNTGNTTDVCANNDDSVTMRLGTVPSFKMGAGITTTNMGYQSLLLSTGINNSAFGRGAGANITTGTNMTCLGFGAVPTLATSSNQVILGNSSVTQVRSTGTYTVVSDARDKKDITPMQAGMEFVTKLKPVNFVWNARDGGKINIPDSGFLAQDLKAVQDETNIKVHGLVYDENPEKLEISAGQLIPVLVKALQEANTNIEHLLKSNKDLEQRISRLEL